MSSPLLAGCFCALVAAGCTADIGSSGAAENKAEGGQAATGSSSSGANGPPGTASPAMETCAPAPQLPQRVRRLTNAEYQSVVAAWLGDGPWQEGLPTETVGRRVIVDSDALIVGDVQFDAYARAAEAIARTGAIERVAACAAGSADEVCLNGFARQASRRLFGRAPSADELQRLRTVYDVAAADGGRVAGLRAAARALLLSPHFLYLSELGDQPGAALSRLTGHETASQLSFFLAGTRPDDELLAAADAGKLKDPVERRRHAERLSRTPAAKARMRAFVRDWFSLSHVGELEKNPRTVPEFTPALRASMDRELDRFIDHAIGDAGGTIGELFTSTTSFVDGNLASVIYRGEVKGVSGDDFIPVKLDPARRRGVLSLPAFLAGHSGANLTSPVERGLAVRRGLLCQPVPPPPPGVTDQAVSTEEPMRTTRQKFERHLNEPSCRACHEAFDPIGFGMEQMDVIGRLRQQEGGLAIDSRGRLSGSDVDGAFVGPAQLSERLATSQAVRSCFAETVLRMSEARGAAPDACQSRRLSAKIAQGGDRVVEAFLGVIETEEFVLRRSAP